MSTHDTTDGVEEKTAPSSVVSSPTSACPACSASDPDDRLRVRDLTHIYPFREAQRRIGRLYEEFGAGRLTWHRDQEAGGWMIELYLGHSQIPVRLSLLHWSLACYPILACRWVRTDSAVRSGKEPSNGAR